MDTFRTFPSHGLTALSLIALSALSAPAQAQTRPSIAGLQTKIADLEAQVTSGTIPNVAGYVTMDLSDLYRPTLRVSGANLQIVNGLGPSNPNNVRPPNDLGNLIVGYDQTRHPSVPAVCSKGEYTNLTDCASNVGVWATNHKSGSHNVVIGERHNYSGSGGLVAGYFNTINGDAASVTGGHGNVASGFAASVSGGVNNTASNGYASVSGGVRNTASDIAASVSGGENNVASGWRASVSGGYGRSATSSYDWAAGGLVQDQ